MAKYVIEDTTLNNTANAIREKTGKTDKITPSNFATEIASIESAPKVTKGIVINECDEDGYVTDMSLVGMTKIHPYYFNNIFNKGSNIWGKAFSFTKLHLPDDITEIGRYAFNNCSELILTNLPSKITMIDENAFQGCTNLALTELPSGITKIYKNCFKSCTNLALTELPSGITMIDEYAFYNCTNLALTSLPSGITMIAEFAFQDCTNLALTELPSGITSIGNYAFQGCTNLALTELPSGITVLGSNVFNNCSNLGHITINGQLTSMSTSQYYPTFGGCTNLSYISLPNVTAVPTICTKEFQNTLIASGTGYIYVPDTLVDSFKSATNWSTYADQIKPISELEVSS